MALLRLLCFRVLTFVVREQVSITKEQVLIIREGSWGDGEGRRMGGIFYLRDEGWMRVFLLPPGLGVSRSGRYGKGTERYGMGMEGKYGEDEC